MQKMKTCNFLGGSRWENIFYSYIKMGGKKMTTEEYVCKAEKKHGSHNFCYSKVVYEGSNEYIIITCKKHGEFRIRARNHMSYGCPRCRNEIETEAKHETANRQAEAKREKEYDTFNGVRPGLLHKLKLM